MLWNIFQHVKFAEISTERCASEQRESIRFNRLIDQRHSRCRSPSSLICNQRSVWNNRCLVILLRRTSPSLRSSPRSPLCSIDTTKIIKKRNKKNLVLKLSYKNYSNVPDQFFHSLSLINLITRKKLLHDCKTLRDKRYEEST